MDLEDSRAVWCSLDLEDLFRSFEAGPLERGDNYYRYDMVVSVSQPSPDVLVGQVSGTWEYATIVQLVGSGTGARVSSRCTCPYEFQCKHAVALILEFQEKVESGAPVSDEVPAPVRELLLSSGLEVPDESGSISPDVRDYVQQLKREQLVELVVSAAEMSGRLRAELRVRARLAGMHADDIKEEILASLEALESGGEDSGPDCGDIAACIDRLVELGETRYCVDLAPRIVATINEPVLREDWGEIVPETIPAGGRATATAVGHAIAASSLSPLEKLLLTDELRRLDFGELIEEMPCVEDFDEGECRAVADEIVEYVGKADEAPPKVSCRADEEAVLRRNLIYDAIKALERIGQSDEALELAVREAAPCGMWRTAARLLMDAGRPQEAQGIIEEAVAKSERMHPATEEEIRRMRREIASAVGDDVAAVALHAESFLASPSLELYRRVRDAAEPDSRWPAVREALLKALETGSISADDWPFPDFVQISVPDRLMRRDRARQVLLDIAIDEEDHDAVLRWYREMVADGCEVATYLALRVADALAEARTDNAIAIWRDLVDAAIAEKSRSAYERALPWLRKMREALVAAGRAAEWKRYLAHLRDEYSRRWALIETIDDLQ